MSGNQLFDLEELDCLYRFDVVDAGTVNNANLLNAIEVQGIEIFSSQNNRVLENPLKGLSPW